MGLRNAVKVWGDVLDPSLDEKAAPSLGDIFLESPGETAIYLDPAEFFKRTLITERHLEILEDVAKALSGEGGSKVIMLQSLFGGGKTHTLVMLLHAVKNPQALKLAKLSDPRLQGRREEVIAKLGALAERNVVVIDGKVEALAPHPGIPLQAGVYKVRTLWGAIAHQLGVYGEVREHDEKIIVPGHDVLVRVLDGRNAVILIDEVAHYVFNLISSPDMTIKDYAKQVPLFFENLAKAVDLARGAVLIVSLPIEVKREGAIEIERGYRDAADLVGAIYRALSRVSFTPVQPITFDDIPLLLRTRLFERIDQGYAKSIQRALAQVYTNNADIFGGEYSKVLSEVERTYPFHPKYVEALIEIIDKHEGLEKTRDVVRISRKVLRKVLSSDEDYEIIMPWHIDMTDHELQSKLLGHETYQGFAAVISDDIVGRTKECEKPELAKLTAIAILVRTFIYYPMTGRTAFFPTSQEIALSVYEPYTFRKLGLQPKDIIDVLDWESRNLLYLLSEGERYWFTALISPIRMVEARARSIDDERAMEKVFEYAKELLRSAPEELVRRRGPRPRRRREARGIFNEELSQVMRYGEPVDIDTRSYVLLACLEPPSEDDLYDMIFRTGRGGDRRYANTVYVIFPESRSDLKAALYYAKILIAGEEVEENIDQMYGDQEELIRRIMKEKLRKYCYGLEGAQGKLYYAILSALKKLAYPRLDKERMRKIVEITPTSPSDTIIETAVMTLKAIKPEKLREDLDFDTLDYLLGKIGVNISEGDTPRSVGEIIDYFYTNPALPMVPKEAVINALMDGVRNLKIGIKRGNTIYFKRVYEFDLGETDDRSRCEVPSVEEGEVPQRLEEDDMVYPWKLALKEQLGSLKPSEKREAEGIRRTWYEARIAGQFIPLEEAVKAYGLEVLKEAPIVKLTRLLREGVQLKLSTTELEGEPGQALEPVEIIVERIGAFSGKVRLEVKEGTLEPAELTINDEVPLGKSTWKLPPLDVGSYSIPVKALSEDGRLLTEVALRVRIRTKAEYVKGVPPPGTLVREIKIDMSLGSPNLRPIHILESRLGEKVLISGKIKVQAEISEEKKPEVVLIVKDVSARMLKMWLVQVVQSYGLMVKGFDVSITAVPTKEEAIKFPELRSDEAKELCDVMYYREA